MKKETRLNHPDLVLPAAQNPPLIEPIYQSVKFTTPDVSDMEAIAAASAAGRDEGYFYTRISNPTVRQLELTLAELQGREDAIAFASGIAAVSTLFLAHLRAGDHVVVFKESYRPTRYLARDLMARFGVTCSLHAIEKLDVLEAELATRKTKLLIFESPTNPMLKIADIARICAAARSHGTLVVLDNTFAGPHQHADFEVDLYIHSLTKFVSGHGDVMGGAIIGSKALIAAMKRDSYELGACLDPHAAYLIQRGLKTYFLRYRKQCENALAVARFLESDSRVARVYYPGLASHPHHARAKAQMQDFGTMVAIDIRGDVSAFIRKLKLFKLAASLGSTDSLVVPVLSFFGRDLTEEERKEAWITPNSVRLSLGVEDSSDLIEDLKQALG